MRMLSIRNIGLAALLAAVIAPQQGQATVYSDSMTLDPTQLVCGYFVQIQACSQVQFFPTPRTANAGDQFNIHFTTNAPFVVPGSSTNAQFYASVFDPFETYGPDAPGALLSSSTVTLSGYQGPAGIAGGPFALNAEHEYLAAAGFFNGSGGAPAGFSFTGADAQFNILAGSPEQLIGMTAGYVVVLASAPTELTALPGGTALDPVLLPPGLVGSVTGEISGSAPTSQFYGFNWGGGLFQTQAQILGADVSASFDFKLLNNDFSVNTSQLLDSSNGFESLMSVLLGAGHYTIGLTTSSPLDPAFTISFLTPVTGGAAVPEPSVWATLLLGFGAIGALLRRRRAQLVWAARARPVNALRYE